ncbi:right-handed parallel beta-helix repeat-containing protein [Streptomyces sp. NBC_00859]|uniref:right-handed parallel beta-helix repeat-containing protein n=1 Tax=Streptomyces sp. NBC_00859 TaxID=2903682 RepID=UPI00386E6338|nr:right-handed parallel beta-helix repeat-containing protein [Streptomyces sp. NBC_00859]
MTPTPLPPNGFRGRLVPAAALLATLTAATAQPLAPASAADSAPSRPVRLVITEGGTARHPAVHRGYGRTVDGITVEADHVVVEGYTVDTPKAPGIEMTGNDITVRNNTVTRPHGGDGDGLRFFGDNLRIQHNTITGASNRYGHADCMQTFASDTPPSHHVLIEGNRCARIDNMCLMAEGPNDGEGDGRGHTYGLTVRNNYCETRKASQTLMFEDVQNATVTGNIFAAAPDHAIGLAIHSTGARVSGNRVSSGIRYEVGIDRSSLPGYRGPRPGGAP